jgi:hypothetical protein
MDRIIWLTLGLALGLIMQAPCKAETYAIIGAGQTRLATYYGYGQWQQVEGGFGFTSDELSNTWSLGIGERFSEHFAIEASYSSLGKYNSFARYTSDADFASGCTEDCAPTVTGWQHGNSKVLEISALLEYWHLFGRVGFGGHESTFVVDIETDSGNTQGRDITRLTRDFGRWTDTGLHGVLGAGIRYAPWRLEYQYRPNICDGGCGYRDAGTWLLSVEIPLK